LNYVDFTSFDAIFLKVIVEEAVVLKGVFNLVNGTGEVVGNGISAHPDIDFVSFTGSGLTGQKISENAAKTIKRVALELGGKSPMVILDDYDMKKAAEMAVSNIIFNAGQVCTLASRTIIPASKENEFIEAVKEVIPNFTVGTPDNEKSVLGPLISKKQFDRVQGYIQKGVDEG